MGYMEILDKKSIAELRTSIGLNQIEFGNLFGVHPMTVSKWERGVLEPNNYQVALMREFQKAAKDKKIRETIGAVLIGAGIAAALYLLLKQAKE